jgi:hypothetical protein
MNIPPTDGQSDSDDEFVTSLQRYSLRPPPPAWRKEILAAAAARRSQIKPWHRSPWLRGMAASWVVSLGLWIDTQRVSPESASLQAMPGNSTRHFDQQDWQSLLALLEKSSPRHRHLDLLLHQP